MLVSVSPVSRSTLDPRSSVFEKVYDLLLLSRAIGEEKYQSARSLSSRDRDHYQRARMWKKK